MIPGRTHKEYNDGHKEEIYLQTLKRYENNKEKYKTQTMCPCGGKYIFRSRIRHFSSKLHINYTIAQYKKPQEQISDQITELQIPDLELII